MLRLVLISILFVSLQGNARHRFVTLQKALNEKLIQANAAALGGHQGFCIMMSIRNLTKDSLVILL
jgi:hypothetical protein